MRDDPPPLLRADPKLGQGVARLVERCLQKQPADRPETARDVAFFLEAIASSTGASPVAGTVADARPLRPSRTQLVALLCGVSLLLTASTWAYVRVTANRAVRETADANFARAERLVRRLHAERMARLGLTARVVVSFPELKALFATDTATIADFLLGYQQRIATSPVLIALGPDGTVLARTDATGATPSALGEQWLAKLLQGDGEGAVVNVGDRPHFAVAMASEAGGTLFGYLVAAEQVSQTFADSVSEATQDEVVLLTREGVLGSTLRSAQTPWRSLEGWHAGGGRADRPIEVSVGAQRFSAREIPLSTEPAVSALLLRSRDEALGPYRRIERWILAMGAAALAASLLGGRWLGRSEALR
jgi:hypothetical protein